MLDVKKYIEGEFGGPGPLFEQLVESDLDPPVLDSVQKWVRRGSMPANWLAVTLALREETEGRPISIIPYLQEWPPPCHCSNKKHELIGSTPSVFD